MMALPGMTRDEFERIRPYVAALPAGTPINLCTAKAPVLAALAETGGAEFSEELLAANRKEGCYPTKEFLPSMVGDTLAQELINSEAVSETIELVPRRDRRAYWHLGIHAVQSDQSQCERHRHPDGRALDGHRIAE